MSCVLLVLYQIAMSVVIEGPLVYNVSKECFSMDLLVFPVNHHVQNVKIMQLVVYHVFLECITMEQIALLVMRTVQIVLLATVCHVNQDSTLL
jgi:hypothetical protein